MSNLTPQKRSCENETEIVGLKRNRIEIPDGSTKTNGGVRPGAGRKPKKRRIRNPLTVIQQDTSIHHASISNDQSNPAIHSNLSNIATHVIPPNPSTRASGSLLPSSATNDQSSKQSLMLSASHDQLARMYSIENQLAISITNQSYQIDQQRAKLHALEIQHQVVCAEITKATDRERHAVDSYNKIVTNCCYFESEACKLQQQYDADKAHLTNAQQHNDTIKKEIDQVQAEIDEKKKQLEELCKERDELGVKVHDEQVMNHDIEENMELLDQLRNDNPFLKKSHECWTGELACQMIEIILIMMIYYGWSVSRSCEMLSRTKRSKSKLLNVFTAWKRTGVIVVKNGKKRGFANQNHPRYTPPISPDAQKAICDEIDRLTNEGETVTARGMQSFIKNITDRLLSLRTINYLFDKWHCGFGKIKEMPIVDPAWHGQRIARFIAKYYQALKLVAAGTHVMVWMDETYIWQNYAKFFSWFTRKKKKHRRMKRDRRSHRLIVLHAMHRRGLVCKQRGENDHDLTKPALTAEYIYTIKPKRKHGKQTKNDEKAAEKDEYHDNVTSKIWLKWHDRLVKTFEVQFPGKKMILILDNAKYHNPHGDGYLPLNSMKREELITALASFGIKEFTLQTEEVGSDRNKRIVTKTYQEHQWMGTARGDKNLNIPINEELKEAIKDHFKRNPRLLMTETEKIMEKIGGMLLFTPPLVPDCQPNEMLWGIVKGIVANLYKPKRTIEETRSQLLEALYDVPPEKFEKMVKHTEKWMNQWIQNEGKEWLQGDLFGELTWDPDKLPHTSLKSRYEESADQQQVDDEDAEMEDQEQNLQFEEDGDPHTATRQVRLVTTASSQQQSTQ